MMIESNLYSLSFVSVNSLLANDLYFIDLTLNKIRRKIHYYLSLLNSQHKKSIQSKQFPRISLI